MCYSVRTIISSNSTQTGAVLQLPLGELPRDYDDVAFLNNRNYSAIFGEKCVDSSNEKILLSVVKIKLGAAAECLVADLCAAVVIPVEAFKA